MNTHPWRITLFGHLALSLPHREIARFQTQKTGELLAYLACFPERPHRRAALYDLLWPEEELSAQQNRLRVALWWLRHEMQKERDTVCPLTADRLYIALEPGAYVSDVAQFERLLHEARQPEIEEDQRSATLEQAISLYRGELLTDYDALWVVAERNRLNDAYLIALRQLTRRYMRHRRLDAALDYARRALQCDPYREESHHLVLQLYLAMGRTRAALSHYRELTMALKSELNAAPSAKTSALIAPYLEQEPPYKPPSESKEAFRFPPLFAAPPLASPKSSGLPRAPYPLYGREEEIQLVEALYAASDARLVTLTGFGGIGKTRLAIAIGERLVERGWSVRFLALSEQSDPAELLERVAQCALKRRSSDVPICTQLDDVCAERPTLFILDGCEKQLDATKAFLTDLLAQTDLTLCLATSQARLGLYREYEIPLRPLATPHAKERTETLGANPSALLFLERAQRAQPLFQLTPHNAPAILELCRRLDGIPLALEIAAAWSSTLTPKQIVQNLTTCLAYPSPAPTDIPLRHQSLQAAVQRSYDLLPAFLREAFVQLTVFESGTTLELAEAVCEIQPLAPLLAQLQERSFLFTNTTDQETRFCLLEPLRRFGKAQLRATDATELQRRHANCYLAFAQQAEAGLKGKESVAWLGRLRAEEENLRAALSYFLQSDAPESLLLFTVALWRYWHLAGGYAEGVRWLERALDACPKASPSLRARAFMGAGNLAYGSGRNALAKRHFAAALRLRRAEGDLHGEAGARASLSNALRDEGRFTEAEDSLREALRLFERLQDPRGCALTWSNLGNVLADQGQLELALQYRRKAMTLLRQLEDAQNIALLANNLADNYIRLDDAEAARLVLQECFSFCQRMDNRETLISALLTLAKWHLLREKAAPIAFCLGAVQRLSSEMESGIHRVALAALSELSETAERLLGTAGFQASWVEGLQTPLPTLFDLVLRTLNNKSDRHSS